MSVCLDGLKRHAYRFRAGPLNFIAETQFGQSDCGDVSLDFTACALCARSGTGASNV